MQIGGRHIQPWQAVLAAVVVIGLVAGGVALATAARDDDPVGSAGLVDANGDPISGNGSDGGDTSSDPKSTDASTPVRPGTTKPGTKPGTTPNQPGTDPGNPATNPTVTPGPNTGEIRKVKFTFWNDTDTKAPAGPEIVTASGGSWKPAIEQNWEVRTINLPIGTTIQLVVYPDGPNGKKITVPLVVSQEAIDNSDEDAVHVAVSDTTVRILGGSVQAFDVSFPRF